ncbi:unnamed protein product [[Candida] boidinii]|uniref:Unnamed protein product n=1 Tax=Candida boidinii TaxID=5477 RepID=A0A9W6SW92_CANBO|nr:hypothetical protein B5S30_g26 [[Candida] boidinii]OWB82012.1 hypothetical protein B5S33_g633 [[Candida] boidinii]GME68332.1 unnamed protein product [[Candida] boidinii]
MIEIHALNTFVRKPISVEMIQFLVSTTNSVISIKKPAHILQKQQQQQLDSISENFEFSQSSNIYPSPPSTPVDYEDDDSFLADSNIPTLYTFIERLIKYSHVQTPTLMSTLVYLTRLREILPPNSTGMETTRHRIFLGCLILAAKNLNDSSPMNKHWTKYTDGLLTLNDINTLERELITYLGWDNLRVYNSDLIQNFSPFLEPIIRRIKFQEEVKLQKMRQSSSIQKPSSPIPHSASIASVRQQLPSPSASPNITINDINSSHSLKRSQGSIRLSSSLKPKKPILRNNTTTTSINNTYHSNQSQQRQHSTSSSISSNVSSSSYLSNKKNISTASSSLSIPSLSNSTMTTSSSQFSLKTSNSNYSLMSPSASTRTSISSMAGTPVHNKLQNVINAKKLDDISESDEMKRHAQQKNTKITESNGETPKDEKKEESEEKDPKVSYQYTFKPKPLRLRGSYGDLKSLLDNTPSNYEDKENLENLIKPKTLNLVNSTPNNNSNNSTPRNFNKICYTPLKIVNPQLEV